MVKFQAAFLELSLHGQLPHKIGEVISQVHLHEDLCDVTLHVNARSQRIDYAVIAR